MTKKIQGIDQAGKTGFIDEFKMIILKISQRLPIKFKAPQIVVNATPEYLNLDELEKDWVKTRNDFRQLIDSVPEHQLNKKIYKHIIVGRLNTIQAVKFLREHTIHHWPQIKRLLK